MADLVEQKTLAIHSDREKTHPSDGDRGLPEGWKGAFLSMKGESEGGWGMCHLQLISVM